MEVFESIVVKTMYDGDIGWLVDVKGLDGDILSTIPLFGYGISYAPPVGSRAMCIKLNNSRVYSINPDMPKLRMELLENEVVVGNQLDSTIIHFKSDTINIDSDGIKTINIKSTSDVNIKTKNVKVETTNATIDATKIAVTGETEITGNVKITGQVAIQGATSVTGDVAVTGDTNIVGVLGATQTLLKVQAPAMPWDKSPITGNVKITEQVAIQGATSVTGDVAVTGDTNIVGVGATQTLPCDKSPIGT